MDTTLKSLNLTLAQATVVKLICEEQLESLREILSQDGLDIHIYLNLEELELSKTDMEREVKNSLSFFEKLYAAPEYLPTIPPDYERIFKHLLFNNPLCKEEYPLATRKIWKALFTKEMVEQAHLVN